MAMSALDRIKSRSGVFRIATLLMGILVLAVGIPSHFESKWVEKQKEGKEYRFYESDDDDSKYKETPYLYKVCGILKGIGKCPHLSMEQYFIAAIIIAFPVALVSTILYVFVNPKRRKVQQADVGCYVVAAILVMIGAIVYIDSAVQIDNLNIYKRGTNELIKYENLRTAQKIAAASLAIIQSLLYGVTALFIFLDNRLTG